MAETIGSVQLGAVAPSSLTCDASCAALLGAMTASFQRVAAEVDRVILLANIDRQPSAVVDALAWHFHVDFYDASLPLETRRELVKRHNEWHRIKGTPAAVERIIETVFGDGYLIEWQDDASENLDKFEFEVHTTAAAAAGDRAADFAASVNAVKNVRSHLKRLVIDDSTSGAQYVGAAIYVHDKITLRTEAG